MAETSSNPDPGTYIPGSIALSDNRNFNTSSHLGSVLPGQYLYCKLCMNAYLKYNSVINLFFDIPI